MLELSEVEQAAVELLRQFLGARLATDPPPLLVTLPIQHATPAVVAQLKAILVEHPGDRPVHLRLTNGTEDRSLMALPVSVDEHAEKHLRVVLGRWAVVG